MIDPGEGHTPVIPQYQMDPYTRIVPSCRSGSIVDLRLPLPVLAAIRANSLPISSNEMMELNMPYLSNLKTNLGLRISLLHTTHYKLQTTLTILLRNK